MVFAINPEDTTPYVCECDRKLDEDKQTVWHFRSLSVQDSDLLQTVGVNVSGKGLKEGAILDALAVGLASWDNFCDENGPIEFETEKRHIPTFKGKRTAVKESLLRRIPAGVRMELGLQFVIAQVADQHDEGDAGN
ncbi:MAG: hypothetical protein AAF196_08965 [Planctomycetota bacterium]